MKDHLTKQPTKAEAAERLALQAQVDIYTLSQQIAGLARACKITPEEFVKTMNEPGANSAFYQNCMLIEEEQKREAAEKLEKTKEVIEQVAI